MHLETMIKDEFGPDLIDITPLPESQTTVRKGLTEDEKRQGEAFVKQFVATEMGEEPLGETNSRSVLAKDLAAKPENKMDPDQAKIEALKKEQSATQEKVDAAKVENNQAIQKIAEEEKKLKQKAGLVEAKKKLDKETSDSSEAPAYTLSKVESHGIGGKVDPLEPRREFIVNPAETPRGWQFCKDRHTVTMKTPENPGLKTSLCGKCEDGYALIPATFLKFKILGVCNFIRRLPLWARATNKERLKYNERSCRFFYSYKGWSLKKDFLAHSSKWKKIREQMSNAKRAHAYHCVMTSLTKDGALGEFRDPKAYDELKKRKSNIKEVQAGEGWNYDA